MKRALNVTIAALLGAMLVHGCEATQQVAVSDLTVSVREAIEAVAPNVPDSAFRVARRGSDYEVSYVDGGVDYRVLAAGDGRILSIRESLTYRPQLEDSVGAAIGDAASACEDLAELAQDGDRPAMEEGVATLRDAVLGATALLRGEASAIEAELGHIEAARAAGRDRQVALGAVELYRLLVSSSALSHPIVPVEVSLLDYAGFRVGILATGTPPPWGQIGPTVRDAGQRWKAIEPQVANKGLRDLMNSTNAGLEGAVRARDANAVRFGAQILLDTVDLLEQFFTDSYKRGTDAVRVADVD